MAEPDAGSSGSRSELRTELAYVRTRIASERTLMAWIRLGALKIALQEVAEKRPDQRNGGELSDVALGLPE